MAVGQSMVIAGLDTREEVNFDDIFETYNDWIYNCVYRLWATPRMPTT